MAATGRAALHLLLTCLVTFGGAAEAAAAAGDLDASFGGDGIVVTDVGGNDRAFAAAMQADSRLVVAGTTIVAGAADLLLARYGNDGSLDTSFGGDGIVVTDLGGTFEEIRGVVVQPDGRIVAAGVSDAGGDENIVVVRYAADGTLDSSFGNGGVVVTDVAGGDDAALALLRQPNGKLVVAGYAFTGLFTDLVVARYEAAGTPDLGFANAGVSTTALGFDTALARALTLQPDGRLLAAGALVSTGEEVVVVRLTGAGAPDPSFDGDGVLTLALTSGDDVARAAAVQSDGRILVAGEIPGGAAHHLVVLQRTSSGGPDSSFDLDGVGLYPLGSSSSARGILAQADGRIVVAGQRVAAGQADVVLLRLDADGGPDAGFGNDGVVITSIAAGDDAGNALLQAGSRLIVAGTSFNGGNDDFAVLRYIGSDCGDGSVDAGEECDDGNVTAGDCCSPSCQYESSATPCTADALACTVDHCNGAGTCVHTAGNAGLVCRPAASVCDAAETCSGASPNCPADIAVPNGTACSDTLFCNGGETCQAGSCQAGSPPCADICDEQLDFCPTNCPAAPRADCRAAERNGLVIRRGGANDRLLWRWLRGASTTQAELADPRSSAGYLLCLYEGAPAALALQLLVPPDASRWSALGTREDRGFRYTDAGGAAAGASRILLRPSETTRTRAGLLARGAALPDPALPLDLPVTLQLNNTATDLCLGSTFSAARRNDGSVFR